MNYIKHILEQNNILHLLKKMLVVLEKLPWMFWACFRALLICGCYGVLRGFITFLCSSGCSR